VQIFFLVTWQQWFKKTDTNWASTII
jgi:hypothetical protein